MTASIIIKYKDTPNKRSQFRTTLKEYFKTNIYIVNADFSDPKKITIVLSANTDIISAEEWAQFISNSKGLEINKIDITLSNTQNDQSLKKTGELFIQQFNDAKPIVTAQKRAKKEALTKKDDVSGPFVGEDIKEETAEIKPELEASKIKTEAEAEATEIKPESAEPEPTTNQNFNYTWNAYLEDFINYTYELPNNTAIFCFYCLQSGVDIFNKLINSVMNIFGVKETNETINNEPEDEELNTSPNGYNH